LVGGVEPAWAQRLLAVAAEQAEEEEAVGAARAGAAVE